MVIGRLFLATTSLPGVVCAEAETPRQIVDTSAGRENSDFHDFCHFFPKTSVLKAIISSTKLGPSSLIF